MAHICISELGHLWYRSPSHCPPHCWLNFQSDPEEHDRFVCKTTSVKQRTPKKIVCETVTVLFRLRCVTLFRNQCDSRCGIAQGIHCAVPDSKVHAAYMGPTWVLSAPGGSHVGPVNLAIWGGTWQMLSSQEILHIKTSADYNDEAIWVSWHHDISNHRYCLVKDLLRLIARETPRRHTNGPLWRNPRPTMDSPHKWPVKAESVFMTLRHHISQEDCSTRVPGLIWFCSGLTWEQTKPQSHNALVP